MRQPLKFAFFFLLLAAGVLSAAENLMPQDVRLYRRSNVAFREGCFVYDVKPGKWTSLAMKLPLKKGVYGCSLEVRSGGTDGKTLLKLVLQPDKPAEKFRREYETKEFSETWHTLSGYLVMPEDGTANVSVYAQGPSPAEIQVRKLRLTALPENDLAVLKLKTEENLALQWSMQWDFRNQPPCLSLVPCEEHIEGGFALKSAPRKGIRVAVESIPLPALENTDYECSLWMKADAEMGIAVFVDGWVSGEKHWYKLQKFRVTDEWREYSFPFRTPELSRYRGMVRIKVNPLADYTSLQIKDAMLKIKERNQKK